MATREVKTRFKLEGEQEFKRAMSDAASSIKVLNSEQKLAEAQFEATGDAEQYAADQARILKEQIAEQKKAVAAAEEAVKKLTENGVEKNSRQMQTWKIKLNNSKIALFNLQRRLDNVGTELSEEESAFGTAQNAGEQFGNKMDEVAKGVNLQNAIIAIDSITEHIESIVRGAARAAKAMWDMGVEASVWADDLATAADKAGVDVETYQSWQYASRFIDTSVEDIVRNWKDIDSKLSGSKESMYEFMASMAEAGVAVETTEGAMRQGKDIFWDMIDYLHSIGDEQERTAAAMTLFGNDWRNLNPLITAGSAAYREMADEGRRVAVVSEDNVKALGGMNDSYEDMQARLQALKMDTLAALAPTFNEVAQALSTAITAMDEFVKSEEGQQALTDLNGALSGLITAFLGEDNGKGTFASIVDTAKTAVQNFSSALNWLRSNGDTVKRIIEGIAGGYAALKVAKEVLTFMALLKATPLSKLNTLFGKGDVPTLPTGGNGGATPGGANSGPAKTSGTPSAAKTASKGGLGTLLGKAMKGVKTGLGAAWAYGAPAIVTAAAMLPAWFADQWDKAQIIEHLTEVKETAAEAAAAIGEEGETALEAVNTAADAMMPGERHFNGRNKFLMTDLQAIEEATNKVAQLNEAEVGGDFLSGKTKLWMKYRSNAGGISAQREQELLTRSMMEAYQSLTEPETTSEVFEDYSDAIDALIEAQEIIEENGVDVESVEGLYRAMDKVINSPKAWEKLSGRMQDKWANFVAPESGYGADSATMYSDAMDLVTETIKELEGVWKEEHPKPKYGEGMWKRPQPLKDAGDFIPTIVEELEEAPKDFASIYSDAMDEIIDIQDALDDEYTAESEAAMYQLIRDLSDNQDVLGGLSDDTKALLDQWLDTESGFGNGSAGIFEDSKTLLEQMLTDLDTAFYDAIASTEDAAAQMKVIGGNTAVGLANGIYEKGSAAIEAAKWLGESVANMTRGILRIASPSKVFEELGEYTGLGFAEGLEDSTDRVSRAVNTMIGATSRGAARSYGGMDLGGRIAGMTAGNNGAVHVTLVLDEEVLGDVMAPIINDKIGATINATRR